MAHDNWTPFNPTAKDIRFMKVMEALYALTLGEPYGTGEIRSLALDNPHERRRVRQARLLGHPGSMRFLRSDQALVIQLPEKLPTRHSSVFKVDFASWPGSASCLDASAPITRISRRRDYTDEPRYCPGGRASR
ncbi:hypothetical protein [Sphingopyxis sp. JAI128]|uniref:hypothetical protein n=1 Tax=Sphingopyxis sp. JAI128 TaxID=2723066 RepID=UPI00161D0F1B|nr:hypothetical protein [Sphingopyxis sp. JAI128]MBB6424728.1 hypothetical protein [Sphingopyxis sp. JAI128]